MNSIAERLQFYRKKNRLTTAEAARRINVPYSTYRDWEEGRKINGEPYPKICEAFGITYEELFYTVKEGERIETFITESIKLLERAHQEHLKELSNKNRRIRRLEEHISSLNTKSKNKNNENRSFKINLDIEE